MSDINLPGMSSKVDVNKVIEKLVKAESKKLDRLNDTRELLDKEKTTWVDLRSKVEELQNAAKQLHGFRSPFQDKIAISSNEDAVTANAYRTAEPFQSKINVEQIAAPERIISDPVSSDRIFEDMPLVIQVGENRARVNFEGGNIQDLAQAINEQAGDHMKAKVTRNTPRTSVLVLESKYSGEKNVFTVPDEGTLGLFQQIGLFEQKRGLEVDTRLNDQNIKPFQGSTYHFRDENLVLSPENSVYFELDQPLQASSERYVKVKLRAVEVEKKEEIGLPWPQLKDIGRVRVEDVEIEGGRPVPEIEKEEKKKPPVVDNQVLGAVNERGQKNTIEVEGLTEEFQEYTFKLSDLAGEGKEIDRIMFLNNNTSRRIEYSDLAIVDESRRRGPVPKHRVLEGRDAVVYIDGVKVQRSSNNIDDAIEGVELNLRGESEREVSLTVRRDYEKITKKIVDMIEKYNKLMKFINDQTKVESSGDVEGETTAGMLTGEIAVMSLKSKLKNIMMNPYPTERGKQLTLLSQIGISMGKRGSSWNDIKGGFLEIDEDTFINAMEKHPEAIEQLFGSDQNQDKVTDQGAAHVLEHTLEGYSDPHEGIISYHIRNTDNRIDNQQEKIEDWKEHLEEYRAKLKKDFTYMQQALNELEQTQKRIENFSTQLNNK
ncbi:MAG: flagellar filament capping protein FliD [Spirochaetota bacterium]